MSENIEIGDAMIICPDCQGTGLESQSENKKCVSCKGRTIVAARLFQRENPVIGRINDKEFWDSMGNNEP